MVRDLGMGVHDPCTMNYMEVYGEGGGVELGSHFEKTLNELI